MSESKENRIKKTRKRIPTSCSICRRRKMKCDKQKPYCGSCQLHGTIDLCVYETQPWIKPTSGIEGNSQLLEEIGSLQDRVKQLEAQLEYAKMINVPAVGISSDGHNPSVVSNFSSGSNDYHSTDTSPSSTQSQYNEKNAADDPLVDLAEKFDCLLIKEDKLMHFGATSYMSSVKNDPILQALFTKYFTKHREKVLGVVFSCGAETDFGLKIQGKPTTMQPETSERYQDIVNDINKILPSKEIVMLLIDRFFDFGYHFVPFVDEHCFRNELDLILGVDATGASCLVVPHNSVLSTVCIFMIMLRFSFLTLPLREYSNRTLKDDPNGLVSKICQSGVSISPVFIEHAKRCLVTAGVLKNVTVKNIQAALFLRVYRLHSPEDGDEGTDSTVLVAMIIQMARAHGFYRDPERFSNVLDAEETRHLWRKIWAHLLYLDAFQAINFGSPLVIAENEYDTKLPFMNDKLRAASMHKAENYVIRAFDLQWEVTKILRSVTRLSGNVNRPVKRSEVESKISEIEVVLNCKMRTFDQLFNSANVKTSHNNNIDRAQEFCHRATLTMLYYILNYILFLTCEPHEGELAEKYSHLATEKALILFKIGYEFCEDTSIKFGSELETIIAPYVLLTTQRSLQIIFSISVRSKYGIFSLIKSFKDFKSIDSIGLISWLDINTQDEHGSIRKVLSYIEGFYSMATKLSYKYFHCWRLCMLIKLFLAHSKEVYPEIYCNEPPKTTEDDDTTMQEAEFWSQFMDETGIRFDYFTPAVLNFPGTDPFLNDTPYGDYSAQPGLVKSAQSKPDSTDQQIFHESMTDIFTPSAFTDATFNVDERLVDNDNEMTIHGDPLSPETKIGLEIARSMFGTMNNDN